MENRLITENSHQELHALLCEAEYKFSQAIAADHIVGRTIFETTLDAIIHFKWNGNLPIIDEYPIATNLPALPAGRQAASQADAAILPPPILVALAYCLDSTQTVCLQQFGLTSGQKRFDQAILAWPGTLLRGLQNKIRFFINMTEVYKMYHNDSPLLSDIQTRAIQLLVIGRHLIREQKQKIGQPLSPQIYRV